MHACGCVYLCLYDVPNVFFSTAVAPSLSPSVFCFFSVDSAADDDKEEREASLSASRMMLSFFSLLFSAITMSTTRSYVRVCVCIVKHQRMKRLRYIMNTVGVDAKNNECEVKTSGQDTAAISRISFT